MLRIRYAKALCVLGLSATTTWGVLSLDVKDGKSDESACIWNDSRGISDITYWFSNSRRDASSFGGFD